jgi:succinate dehydrogenase/fumarate reductase-like Fe-S protein
MRMLVPSAVFCTSLYLLNVHPALTHIARTRSIILVSIESSISTGSVCCHTILNCAQACPKDLNPGRAIAEIKKLMAQRRH